MKHVKTFESFFDLLKLNELENILLEHCYEMSIFGKNSLGFINGKEYYLHMRLKVGDYIYCYKLVGDLFFQRRSGIEKGI